MDNEVARNREKNAAHSTKGSQEMTLEYTSDQFGLICNMLHQAICERRPEPDLDPDELGFTGPAERAFATVILASWACGGV
jgi:hypothetical protein